tara:strand:- start:736 stop:1080 length:345 start_codon:yes stop_codon:yes gene_type:complete
MIILQESGSSQNIDFIPRSFTSGRSYSVSIVNEVSNKEIHSATTTGITSNLYFNRYSAVFATKQDIFYNITIKDGSTVIFKDKIFCTNQTDLTNYSVNNGVYRTNSDANEFITV